MPCPGGQLKCVEWQARSGQSNRRRRAARGDRSFNQSDDDRARCADPCRRALRGCWLADRAGLPFYDPRSACTRTCRLPGRMWAVAVAVLLATGNVARATPRPLGKRRCAAGFRRRDAANRARVHRQIVLWTCRLLRDTHFERPETSPQTPPTRPVSEGDTSQSRSGFRRDCELHLRGKGVRGA